MKHQIIDQRSFELDKAIAVKIRAHPALLDVAKEHLNRWLSSENAEDLADPLNPLVEWNEILNSRSLPELLALLESDAPEPVRLRQSSPFVGILSEEERLAIFRKYETFRTRARY